MSNLRTVRGVPDDIWNELRAKATAEGMNTGQALTFAIEFWVHSKPKRRSLLDLEPFDWDDDDPNTSMKVDEILYGGKD